MGQLLDQITNDIAKEKVLVAICEACNGQFRVAPLQMFWAPRLKQSVNGDLWFDTEVTNNVAEFSFDKPGDCRTFIEKAGHLLKDRYNVPYELETSPEIEEVMV